MDTTSMFGILMQNKESGAQLKETVNNLDASSIKLNENLEAIQHSFLLRGFFRRKAKAINKE
jgi:phospholipid/cholesterol/gamma-HCH transport system substrate-binding protein